MNKREVKLTMYQAARELLPYGIIMSHKRRQTEKRLETLPCTDGPALYNEHGERLKLFYLSDSVLGWQYYSFTRFREPRHVFWDRNNTSLRTHFYSHGNIGTLVGNPEKRFAIIVETESIDPGSYALLLRNPGLAREFSGIFTHSARLLDRYGNTRFMPAGGVWYGLPIFGGTMDPSSYLRKSKNVSIVSSNKSMCPLHLLRIEMAKALKASGTVDTYGTFDGGRYVKIAESLTEYRYSIIVENSTEPYCFTEKVMNCFAAMTIPIYIGASKISEFFNPDGIIVVNEQTALADIGEIVNKCSEEDYMSREEAILDNYNRVKSYYCQEDYICAKYGDMLV